MFFSKKESRPVSPEEVAAMSKKGMSDKDIIKALKSKGYSYNDIERAMLSAVKSGVEEKKLKNENPDQNFAYDFAEPDTSPESQDSFDTQDLFPEEPPQVSYEDLPQLSQSQEQPVEELVEGIVEEKWQHFQEELARFEEGLERLQADIKVMEEKIEASRRDIPEADTEARINEISDHIDDVNARVGGLERAFKQFLPSLTKNIESLTAIVNEMKSKQEPKSFAPASPII